MLCGSEFFGNSNSNLTRCRKTAQPHLGPRIYEGAAERSEAGGVVAAQGFYSPRPSGAPPSQARGARDLPQIKQLHKPEFIGHQSIFLKSYWLSRSVIVYALYWEVIKFENAD